jgi:hypothetical protein
LVRFTGSLCHAINDLVFLVTYSPYRSPMSLLLCSFFSCKLIAIPWDACNVLVSRHCYWIGTLSLFARFIFGPVLGLLNHRMVAVFFTPLMLIYFVVLVALFMFKGHSCFRVSAYV